MDKKKYVITYVSRSSSRTFVKDCVTGCTSVTQDINEALVFDSLSELVRFCVNAKKDGGAPLSFGDVQELIETSTTTVTRSLA